MMTPPWPRARSADESLGSTSRPAPATPWPAQAVNQAMPAAQAASIVAFSTSLDLAEDEFVREWASLTA